LCIVAEEIARICGGFAIGVMASVLAPPALAQIGGRKAASATLQPLLQGAVLPAMLEHRRDRPGHRPPSRPADSTQRPPAAVCFGFRRIQ
jgi:alkylation response protein AidB-like acyl-CoA dehydrogenase